MGLGYLSTFLVMFMVNVAKYTSPIYPVGMVYLPT